MFGLVCGAWVMARRLVAARSALAGGASGDDADAMERRAHSALFYLEQLLPATAGLLPAVTAGAGSLGLHAAAPAD